MSLSSWVTIAALSFLVTYLLGYSNTSLCGKTSMLLFSWHFCAKGGPNICNLFVKVTFIFPACQMIKLAYWKVCISFLPANICKADDTPTCLRSRWQLEAYLNNQAAILEKWVSLPTFNQLIPPSTCSVLTENLKDMCSVLNNSSIAAGIPAQCLWIHLMPLWHSFRR